MKLVVLATSGLALALACASVSRPWTPARRTAAAKCSACHPVPEERSVAREQWPALLADHADRLQLSPEHQRLIESWVVDTRAGPN